VLARLQRKSTDNGPREWVTVLHLVLVGLHLHCTLLGFGPYIAEIVCQQKYWQREESLDESLSWVWST